LIGAFNQPKAIFLDTNFLATLNDRQYFNGYAEIIKTAAIRDASLFQLLEDNVEKLATKRDADLLLEVILRTATLKAEVVAEDPTEAGVRSILNFGHTVGHAIEAIYFPEMLHGECVSIGMVLETKLADFLNHLASSSIIGRLTRCLQAYKLPVQLPKGISFQTMVQKMFVDKKNANSQIRCTIIKSIGDAIPYPIPVEEPVWKQILLPFVAIRPGLVSGHILVPGSKSISNRALALCALAKGLCQSFCEAFSPHTY
jgi:pentafunctional AROM polypeptide